MTTDDNHWGDDQSSAVPSQWEGMTEGGTDDSSDGNAELPPRSRRIPFLGMNVVEYWDRTTKDGRPWLRLALPVKKNEGTDNEKEELRTILRGTIRVDRMYQVVKLSKNRFKQNPDSENLTYVVRVDMGDDRPEPIVGRVTEDLLREAGSNKDRWVSNIGLFRHVNPMYYKFLRPVIIAMARNKEIEAFRNGKNAIEDVFAETGMLRSIGENGERIVFLTAGDAGAVGPNGWEPDYKTELPAEYEHESARRGFGYRPATESTLKESFEELLKMLELMPNKPFIPAALLGINAVAPMHGIHDGARTAMAIIGPKKQGKTSLVSLLQANQSPTMRGKGLEPTVNASGLKESRGSTVYGISRAVNRFGGFVVSIDDVITAFQMESETDRRYGVMKIDRMLRNLHGGAPDKAAGFDKVTKAPVKAEYEEMMSLPIFTLEDIPRTESIETVTSRMIVLEHESLNDIEQDVMKRLWSVESGSLRFNAMCAIVQEYTRNPVFFDEAYREAESYVDEWEIADFARERVLYASVLAGNIVAIKLAKSHGVKTPAISKVAGWLYEAAKRQSQWCTPEVREENDPLETFRSGFAEAVRKRFGTFSIPTDSKTNIVYPPKDGTTLGLLDWSHLGYTAGPKFNPDEAMNVDDMETEGLSEGEYPIKPMNPSHRIGTFVFWPGGSRTPALAKISPQPDKGHRRFVFSTSEFDALYNFIDEWARRNRKPFVSKTEVVELLSNQKVGGRFKEKGHVIAIDAYWLTRVLPEA